MQWHTLHSYILSILSILSFHFIFTIFSTLSLYSILIYLFTPFTPLSPFSPFTSPRYHSFYPWHTGNAYAALECPKDAQYKQWVRDFNKYDLYTKCELVSDIAAMKAYYLPIAEKYLGTGPIYW